MSFLNTLSLKAKKLNCLDGGSHRRAKFIAASVKMRTGRKINFFKLLHYNLLGLFLVLRPIAECQLANCQSAKMAMDTLPLHRCFTQGRTRLRGCCVYQSIV
jgi:hypothetical protein